MQIKSLQFDDPAAGWSLHQFEFFRDITLLVGLSGVGKTRILDTLDRLKTVSQGKSSRRLFGVTWTMVFEHCGDQYEWHGHLGENLRDEGSILTVPYFLSDDEEEEDGQPEFVSEWLTRNETRVIFRDGDSIELNGNKTPKLSRRESAISLLKHEDSVKTAFEGLQAILSVDHSGDSRSRSLYFGNLEPLKRKLTTIGKLREHDMPTNLKLAIAYENCRNVFDDIVRQFQEAFPSVERVEILNVQAPHFGTFPRLFLYEFGVDKPIPQEAISSGMLRTLMHLSRMALWPDGTVVLIDEFENSFGVNCIHFVTQDLQIQSQRMQFILTSHHPYIINNISMENWKVVSRKGREVRVENSAILGKKSRHDAFLRLLNMPQYTDGISTQ